jgi:hypothetical protein
MRTWPIILRPGWRTLSALLARWGTRRRG